MGNKYRDVVWNIYLWVRWTIKLCVKNKKWNRKFELKILKIDILWGFMSILMKKHKEITILPINMNEEVKFMIKRVDKNMVIE